MSPEMLKGMPDWTNMEGQKSHKSRVDKNLRKKFAEMGYRACEHPGSDWIIFRKIVIRGNILPDPS